MTARRINAFTVVELLCVIVVGAILMAIVIPLASGARRQYAIAESKARFHRYSLAMEEFKAEYAAYPYSSSPVTINATPGQFEQIMTGHNLNGSIMDDPVAQTENPKATAFIQFSQSELTSDGQLQDAFGQTNITLYIDTDGDGFLNGITGMPDGIRGSIGWQSTGPQGTFSSWQ